MFVLYDKRKQNLSQAEWGAGWNPSQNHLSLKQDTVGSGILGEVIQMGLYLLPAGESFPRWLQASNTTQLWQPHNITAVRPPLLLTST